MLGMGPAKVRWSTRRAITRLRDRNGEVSALGEAIKDAPCDEVPAAGPQPRLMAMQEDHGRPGALSAGLFQEIFDMLGRIVRVSNRQALGAGSSTCREDESY